MARSPAWARRHDLGWACRVAGPGVAKPVCRTPISEAGQRNLICSGRAREATLEKSDLCTCCLGGSARQIGFVRGCLADTHGVIGFVLGCLADTGEKSDYSGCLADTGE